MRIVPNNRFLYKWNLTNTSLCDVCTMFVETNKHLFWECQFSRAFWTDLEVFLTEKQLTVRLDYKIISLGYTEWSSSSYLLNFIKIYAKYFIFKNKYSNTVLQQKTNLYNIMKNELNYNWVNTFFVILRVNGILFFLNSKPSVFVFHSFAVLILNLFLIIHRTENPIFILLDAPC